MVWTLLSINDFQKVCSLGYESSPPPLHLRGGGGGLKPPINWAIKKNCKVRAIISHKIKSCFYRDTLYVTNIGIIIIIIIR